MATISALPNELLVAIFSQLGVRDLQTVRSINQQFASVLQQGRLLYRLGVFTRLGLRFPCATNPLPFLDLPELGVAAVKVSEGARILDNLQRLELRPHSPDECVTSHLMWVKSTALAAMESALKLRNDASCDRRVLPVLYVELLTPTPAIQRQVVQGGHDPSLLSTLLHHLPEGLRNEDSASHRALQYSVASSSFPNRDKTGCCHMDSTVVNEKRVKFSKVVVRNAPVLMYHHNPFALILPRFVDAESHCVLVINSANLWKDEPSASCLGRSPESPESPLYGYGLGPRSPNAGKLTIVFLAGGPQSRWVPPCSHFNDTTQSLDSLFHKCSAMDRIWEGMMANIGRDRRFLDREVTLVNTDAIMSLATPQNPAMSLVEAYLRSRFPKMFNKAIGLRSPPIFRTMQQWIQEGHAEDVFSPEELAPFKVK